jgi:hypothetical protein
MSYSDGVYGTYEPIFSGAGNKGINTKVKGIIFGLLLDKHPFEGFYCDSSTEICWSL